MGIIQNNISFSYVVNNFWINANKAEQQHKTFALTS